jgi:hypothetical protein
MYAVRLFIFFAKFHIFLQFSITIIFLFRNFIHRPAVGSFESTTHNNNNNINLCEDPLIIDMLGMRHSSLKIEE